jgi:hypothetical protein
MQYSLNYDDKPISSTKCPNQKSKRLLIVTSSKNKTTGYVINEIGDDIVLDFDVGGHDPFIDSGDDGVDGFTLNFSFGTIYKYDYEVHIKITDKGVFVTEVVGAKYRSDGLGLAKNIDKKFPMVEQNRISKITKKQIFLLGF